MCGLAAVRITVRCEDAEQQLFAAALAERLHLELHEAETDQQLLVTDRGLLLKISPFLPLQVDFSSTVWQKRHDEGKKQGLIRACKPVKGMRIIDATAGWGRDAAILATYGSEVLMLERNPLMSAMLEDAVNRQDDNSKALLQLKVKNQDAICYLQNLKRSDYPDLIYLDPMHPARQKSALVKKDLQVLQQLIGPDQDALALLQLAKTRARKVVVKWPQNLPPLMTPSGNIAGRTVRFDIWSR